MYNQILLTNILRILDESGMTKKELAQKADISSSFLSDLTLDRANPSLRIMEAIASALETPLPVLLELTDLNKDEMDVLMRELPQANYSDGFSRVCAVLNRFQAFQVNKWDAENKKERLARKKNKK